MVVNNMKAVKKILKTAKKTVTRKRRDSHGQPENSFEMIADLWSVYIRHVHKQNEFARLTNFDVAQMMVLLKIARARYGNTAEPDHYVDQAGYSALAAAMGGVGLSLEESDVQ
jgi:poly(3-hydroxyalkanoate) synthetase